MRLVPCKVSWACSTHDIFMLLSRVRSQRFQLVRPRQRGFRENWLERPCEPTLQNLLLKLRRKKPERHDTALALPCRRSGTGMAAGVKRRHGMITEQFVR